LLIISSFPCAIEGAGDAAAAASAQGRTADVSTGIPRARDIR
jgi:hypothetical protein